MDRMGKRFDVYGLGNALVDIQYDVDPAWLRTMGIDEGVMTLVDEARQQALIDALDRPPVRRSSGGSAANSMIALAVLGGRASYACLVGDDDLGAFYLDDLEAAGVACNRNGRAHGTTGRCLVLITPDAERTMSTFLGITASFGPRQIDEAVVAGSRYLYIEGYLLSSDSGFEAALAAQRYAHARDTRIALTLSDPFIVGAFGKRVERLIETGVDLLFCNEHEARAWTGADDLDAACAALGRQVGGFAVTCGAGGARVGDGGKEHHVPGVRVKAVDTNGAGDAFAGAFLYGITRGQDAVRAARLANLAASKVVSRYGPRLEAPLDDDLRRALEG
jgi:fructokinase